MSDYFNFEDRFHILNNENCASEPLGNELEDIEVGFKFNFNGDHSEFEPNPMKIDTFATEFERLINHKFLDEKEKMDFQEPFEVSKVILPEKKPETQPIQIASLNIYNNFNNNFVFNGEKAQMQPTQPMNAVDYSNLSSTINNNLLKNICELKKKFLDSNHGYLYSRPNFRKFSDEPTYYSSSHKNSLEILKEINKESEFFRTNSHSEGRGVNSIKSSQSIFKIEKIPKSNIKKIFFDENSEKIQKFTKIAKIDKIENLEKKHIKSAEMSSSNLTNSIYCEMSKDKSITEEFSINSAATPSNKREIKKCLKLLRNRVSAQKSRQKKKAYINSLEQELERTKEQLNFYKGKFSGGQEEKGDNTNFPSEGQEFELTNQKLKCKENEFFSQRNLLEYFTSTNYTLFPADTLSKIKTEYFDLQDKLVIDLFKKMIRTLIPLELKFIEKKILKINEIVSIQSLEGFLEHIVQNQLELSEMYNFEFLRNDNSSSLPLKLYFFMEQLKNFSLRFREFLFEVKKVSHASLMSH